ncbi:hypothetical protein BU14_0103s0028 [Porphyra umbilicalis]|uniref:Uncharacterized protein n=1 Tax=Porphyra umbilicalis TaxID=2786 RepID=A0A1X6PCX2_PORUM|nr:hypothetical protein BU14_0103s0028 [Porphyra umbilicalis]|eukprot:OSX78684.1 hypothetical protein BU14_0103s0028 [Porphyra umbilicalis]
MEKRVLDRLDEVEAANKKRMVAFGKRVTAVRLDITSTKSQVVAIKTGMTGMRQTTNAISTAVSRGAVAMRDLAAAIELRGAGGGASSNDAIVPVPSNTASFFDTPRVASWTKQMVKDIRAEVTAEFLAGNVWPPASSNREMYARHLHKKFNFPGGMPEARLMLMKEILTPCDPARNHGSTSRKLPVHRVLRRALPRFHRAVLEAATNGFIECTSSMLKIGWKGDKGQKKNVWQMTAAQAKQCLVGMWWITDDVGREALLAALGSALAKIKGLNGVMIEASESRRRYYKVLYSVHVAVAAKVFISLNAMAGYPPFTAKGGNVDEAYRKVWGVCMQLADGNLKKTKMEYKGLELLDGEDTRRADVVGFNEARLRATRAQVMITAVAAGDISTAAAAATRTGTAAAAAAAAAAAVAAADTGDAEAMAADEDATAAAAAAAAAITAGDDLEDEDAEEEDEDAEDDDNEDDW